MSIHIRIYPQPWSIGWRRNRARRLQQQAINRQFAWQQQMINQQSFNYGTTGYGTGFGTGYGYGTGVGTGFGYSSPYGSSWGYSTNRYPSYYGSYGSAFSGAYALPGYAGYTSAAAYYSPLGVAQYGAGYYC